MKESTDNSNNNFLKTDGGKTKSNAIEVPSISLPKGGGAIIGIDEKFSVNAVNGTASFSIPLPFSPARGASPSLSLSYNSGGGNGIFGLGWNLGLASLKRKTDKGLPQYLDAIDSDTFLFSEAEDLVPAFKKQADGSFELDANGDFIIHEKDSPDGLFTIRYYLPRIEGLFARIERWTAKDNSEIKWRMTTRDNSTSLFGWTANSRIANPLDETKIFEWLPEFVFDDKGNCAQYIYKKEDSISLNDSLLHNRNRIKDGQINYSNTYLEKVFYGNKTPYKNFANDFPAVSDYLFSTVFDYGTLNDSDSVDALNDWDCRLDAFSDYKSGFEIRTTRLCKRVLLFHHFTGDREYEGLVKSLNFKYDTNVEEDFTFLVALSSHGYIKKDDGSYSTKQLPPMEFEYQAHDWNKDVKNIAADELVHAPAGLDQQQYQFSDLYNEGLSGILTEQANGWYYKHNLGNGKFEQAKLVTPKPSFAGLGSAMQLADLDADGGKQLISFSNEPAGYFELDDESEWQGFRSFKTMPNIDFADANTRLLDLNGDGKPEVMISEDNIFTWYPSEGRNGYSRSQKTTKPIDEEAGPAVVFADQKQTIFLADMSGDGMTDIVRIRNGEVCYWPNMGYGKFGTKVAVDNAPVFDYPDAFNPAYIRLADIDGSGTTDIIYLGKIKFSCWKNLSGNRFGTSPFEMDSFPEIHSQANITVTDILGNGVACIVWSSPLSKDANAPLKYIDLMNSKKPHIMVSYKNNLGKEASFEYTPSTKFYIEDKLAGKPWVTKLHFPVHCVSKTITEDKISGYKFISEYKYHHGYFDHPEGEFRGFGMVEQKDAETFEHWKKSDATNITEEPLHQEPVVSKSWHHTGAFLQKDKILNQFAHEYWYEEMARQGFAVTNHEVTLPDAKIVDTQGNTLNNLTTGEWREALRACKGMGLRSEIFALDAKKFGDNDDARKKELTPFSVGTHSWLIEMLQPKGKNKHAVFVVKESEAISYSYERNSEDPRIAHNLNLKLDEFGNVLEAASVVYPRLIEDASLPAETREEQNKTIIIYSENQFTNDVITDDVYRLRVPSEAKTFELKAVVKTSTYYSPSDFENMVADSNSDRALYHEIDKPLIDGKPQRRLIEHIRSTYYENNLSGALPLHQLESLAMPFESFQLAYTPELVADIFDTKVNAALLTEGKFTHSESDDNWWIRSGTTQLTKETETVLDAQNRFYAPVSYTDPYGAVTKVKYYGSYFLFIEETEDAIGNKAGVDTFNFRTLSPKRMRDINNNLSEAISDELGLVKAMAVLGKGTEADELIGLTEETNAAETTYVQNFFNAVDSVQVTAVGKNLLQHATARFVYDFETYSNSGKPAVVAAISREEHFQNNPDSPVQIAFEYSNGIGEVIMKKVQAEPGKAKQVIVNPDNTIVINEMDTAASNPTQLRWIGNGRVIKNNKGNAVKQYEPYFSVNHHFEDVKELVETGVTPVLYYDAAGRLVKTEMPDGTFSKVEFDAWKQTVYDANDTVLESDWYAKRSDISRADYIANIKEQEAAAKAAKHFNTPDILHFDTLGRPVLSVEHNKNNNTEADEFYHTKVKLDAEGNLRSISDARENTVMEYQYDMLGNNPYQLSMDAGQRWIFNNIMGNPVHSWDSKDQISSTRYDVLQRPIAMFLETGDRSTFLIEKISYGEGLPDNQAYNLRGQVAAHYDSSGRITNIAFDFKGNLLEGRRNLAAVIEEPIIDWTEGAATNQLEEETFTINTQYDALGRMTRLYNWHRTPERVAVYLQSYNERGVLVAEDHVTATQITTDGFTGGTRVTAVSDITYNEKGQRINMRYGNNTNTRYQYDPLSFRLISLRTTGNLSEAPHNLTNPNVVQDLLYTYDAVGNISEIEENAYDPVFFNNQEVEPKSKYVYDALYRLIRAEGRENNNFNNAPGPAEPSPVSAGFPVTDDTLRNYTQTYQYDAVGNILQMRHNAGTLRWTRNYEYASDSNRLLLTSIGDETVNYSYDGHGSMLNYNNSPDEYLPHWDYRDRVHRIDLGGGGIAFYQYDGQLERSKKRIVKAGGIIEERLYLGGMELYRRWNNHTIEEEIETHHLFFNDQRVLITEDVIETNNSLLHRGVFYRYQYSNHLGSVGLEINENAAIISYEEYHPYGTVAFHSSNKRINAIAKRYRYTGMERDEESGLNYHSARYYLPWLGRWLSADPIGVEGGINLYEYGTSNPVKNIDRSGKIVFAIIAIVAVATIAYAAFAPRVASAPAEDHTPEQISSINRRNARSEIAYYGSILPMGAGTLRGAALLGAAVSVGEQAAEDSIVGEASPPSAYVAAAVVGAIGGAGGKIISAGARRLLSSTANAVRAGLEVTRSQLGRAARAGNLLYRQARDQLTIARTAFQAATDSTRSALRSQWVRARNIFRGSQGDYAAVRHQIAAARPGQLVTDRIESAGARIRRDLSSALDEGGPLDAESLLQQHLERVRSALDNFSELITSGEGVFAGLSSHERDVLAARYAEGVQNASQEALRQVRLRAPAAPARVRVVEGPPGQTVTADTGRNRLEWGEER